MQPDLILCNAVISASNSGHAEQNDLAAWCCMVLHGAAWCYIDRLLLDLRHVRRARNGKRCMETNLWIAN